MEIAGAKFKNKSATVIFHQGRVITIGSFFFCYGVTRKYLNYHGRKTY